MLKLNVVIGQIDMYGFQGRELHPLPEDSGKTAEVMSIQLQRFTPDPIDDFDVVVARLADGRVVELVELEIASITGAVLDDCDGSPR